MKKVLSILTSLLILISSIFNVNVCAKAEIPIAMCLDNKYTLPTIVAMTSMLENVKEGTEYKYYLLVPGDFTDENKQKILSLKEKYKSKPFDINFIDMKDEFKTAKQSLWGAAAYYRLRLPSVLNQYDKCIYLDGDLIVNKDLSELYNIDLEDNYVGGIRDFGMDSERAKDFGMKCVDKHINSGVLLMNLKKLRDDRLEDKFKWFVENKKEKLLYTDQDTLNVCCFDKIKILPLKYNFAECFLSDRRRNYFKFYGKTLFNEAFNDPVVIHYITNRLKPWKNFNALFAEKWWEYAVKSGFYDNMPEGIKVKINILSKLKDVEAKSQKVLDDGVYTISSKVDPNMCLTVQDGSKNSCAHLQLSIRDGADAQKFKVQYNSDGYYTIKAMCSEKVLDVDSFLADIFLCMENEENTQKWFIVPDGEGFYCLVSKSNDSCMEVNGTNIRCLRTNGGDKQRFEFEKCEDNPGNSKKSA